MSNKIGSKIVFFGFSILFLGSIASAQEGEIVQSYSSEECEQMCESTSNPCYSSCLNQAQAQGQSPAPVSPQAPAPAQVKPVEQVNRPLIISREPEAVLR